MLSSQLHKSSTKLTSLLARKKQFQKLSLYNIRLRATSRSYSEPWGLHPLGALRSAPTGRSNKTQSLQHKTPSNFMKLLEAFGATPSGCTKKCPHWKIK